MQDEEMIMRAIQLGKEHGLQICLDLACYNIVTEYKELFSLLVNKYVDIVFANEEEARSFTGLDPHEALEVLGQQCSIAVVKMGDKGSYIRKGTQEVRVDATPVKKVVDTTGAGDYYAAGFLYGLTSGYALEKCATIGSILAGYVIQGVGTTISKKNWNEIKLKVDEVVSE